MTFAVIICFTQEIVPAKLQVGRKKHPYFKAIILTHRVDRGKKPQTTASMEERTEVTINIGNIGRQS